MNELRVSLPTTANGARLDVPAGFRVTTVAVEFGTVVVHLAVAESAAFLEATAAEFKLVLNGRKIEAIKSYRLRTGAALKDAKDAIDKLDPNYVTPGPIGY